MARSPDAITRDFLRLIFGEHGGYLHLASKGAPTPSDNGFRQASFLYPDHLDAALVWIGERRAEQNLYFSPMLFKAKRRIASEVTVCPVLWADLDTANPDPIEPRPHIVLETSPGRWQAFWRLSHPAPPSEAAAASRRIAYAYHADLSGWDLTQLLRLPTTINFKYPEHPKVQAIHVDETSTITLEPVYALPDVPRNEAYETAIPGDLPEYDDILRKFQRAIPYYLIQLHDVRPSEDWSKTLWSLELSCFEVGMTREETFVFARTSNANKYRRDGRSESELWNEVCKAEANVEVLTEDDFDDPITIQQIRRTSEEAPDESFIDRYVRWASERTDAPPQYHVAGGFMILSAILAENVRLALAHTDMVPNIWFMLLGDSTTSRKTTAMEMALRLLNVTYEDAFLATESSVEGMLTALVDRRGISSVFARDEFAGMLEAMKRKDYFAGMTEMFSRLYDGRREKRVLRHQTYDVRDPILIMFCGGAKTRIQSQLNTQYILDGFMPRFIYITAEVDPTRLVPIQRDNGRLEFLSADLAAELFQIRAEWDVKETITLGDNTLTEKTPKRMDIEQDALDRYNEFEFSLLNSAIESDEPEIWLPMMDRFAKSILKAATLLTAARSKRDEAIIQMRDVLKALTYAEAWLPSTLEMTQTVGRTVDEQWIQRLLAFIRNGRNTKRALLRATHLPAKELTYFLEEMEARGLVTITRKGTGIVVTPTHTRKPKVET